MPEGWAVAYDAQKRPYYWHTVTKKVQWERPTKDTPTGKAAAEGVERLGRAWAGRRAVLRTLVTSSVALRLSHRPSCVPTP